jgi:hypothetical protein
MEYRYNALLVEQTRQPKPLVLFAAPAVEIDAWVGVPQKKRLGNNNDETVGFQRDENPNRVKSLEEFFENDQNIIQNALLGATRTSELGSVKFEPLPGEAAQSTLGTLIIDLPDYAGISLENLFGYLRQHLEERVPELTTRKVEETARFLDLQQQIAINPQALLNEPDADDSSDESPTSDDDESPNASSALFEESHILDFWVEVASRHELLKKVGSAAPRDEFLGFSRDSLLSFLRPVVLVDGQHRLRGAIDAARSRMNSEAFQPEIQRRIREGENPTDVEYSILTRESRTLPMSLLMSSDPEEQVFQFVVVNQKATPIGRALLGTIVSTTLSNEEIDKVALRLKSAGIQLEESQAITFLARSQESPFYGLVERGMTGDARDLLQWTALASLIAIFRELKGGRLYGQKIDYASLWHTRYLNESGIVANADLNEGTKLDHWRRLDGPWRIVFMKFFSTVRDELGSTFDPDRYNFWGKTRSSNLFNKVSLTILASDFFQFLTESKKTIDSAESVPELVKEWLEYVNRSYFDKDWNLSGVKKDSTGIRNQWAQVWCDYRRAGGSLPDKRQFRKIKGE